MVFDRLLTVVRVGVDRYRESQWVDFDWIQENGDIRFYQSPSSGTGVTGSGTLELGRFLHKAERQL